MTTHQKKENSHLHTAEKTIGNTVFVVTSECSSRATETVEQKLERLICRHASDTESYQYNKQKSLAMCGEVREYTTDTIVKE